MSGLQGQIFLLVMGLELIQCHPGVPLKNLSTFLKVCFLNFNTYFNLKRHNFKANSESVYKLSRFATGRILFILYGIIIKMPVLVVF